MKNGQWKLMSQSRETVGDSELVKMFDPAVELSSRDLLEVLHLVAKEVEVPIGQLRPSDKFEDIFRRPRSYNPLRLLLADNAIALKEENLEFPLWARRKKLGFPKNAETIVTVKDYVTLWCKR
jgi:hypothetical protein